MTTTVTVFCEWLCEKDGKEGMFFGERSKIHRDLWTFLRLEDLCILIGLNWRASFIPVPRRPSVRLVRRF